MEWMEREEKRRSFNCSLGRAPPQPFSEGTLQQIRNYISTVPGQWTSERLTVKSQCVKRSQRLEEKEKKSERKILSMC